jgi:hypothetical protein
MEIKTDRHSLKILWARRSNRYWSGFKALPFFQFLPKLPLAKGGFMWSLKIWRLEINWYVKADKIPHKVGVARDESVVSRYQARKIAEFETPDICIEMTEETLKLNEKSQ